MPEEIRHGVTAYKFYNGFAAGGPLPRRRRSFGTTPARRRRNSTKSGLAPLAFLAVLFVAIAYATDPAAGAMLTLLVGVPLGLYAYHRMRTSRRADRVLLEMGVASLDGMDGIEFERFLRALFARLGYNAKVTQAGSDYGVDVILKKDGRRVAVQAKRHGKPVGLKAVQEVRSGMDFYGADEGWVVTNSTFTKSAGDLASRTGVRLVDGNRLRKMIAGATKPVTSF